VGENKLAKYENQYNNQECRVETMGRTYPKKVSKSCTWTGGEDA